MGLLDFFDWNADPALKREIDTLVRQKRRSGPAAGQPTDELRQRQFLGDKRLRGLNDALMGLPDMAGTLANVGIRDVDYFTGGGLSGGTYDPYQFGAASDTTAELGSRGREALTGIKNIDPKTMPADVQAQAERERKLLSMIPTGAEDIAPIAMAGMPVIKQVTGLMGEMGKPAAKARGLLDEVKEAATPAQQFVEPGGVLGAVAEEPSITVYHGTPHKFDKFEWSPRTKGTGEGAQAYGQGLYFAESEGVAKSYRDALSKPAHGSPESVAINVMDAVNGNPSKAIAELERRKNSLAGMDPKNIDPTAPARFDAAIDLIKSGKPLRGHVYEVKVKADPEHFINYDEPLAGQSPHVQGILSQHGFADPNIDDMKKQAMSIIDSMKSQPGVASWVPKALDEVATEIATAQSPSGVYLAVKDVPLGFGLDDSKLWSGIKNDVNGILGALRNAGDPRLPKGLGPRVAALPEETIQTLSQQGIPGIGYLDAGSRGKLLLDGKPIASDDYVAKAAADAMGTYGSKDAAIKALGAHPGYKNTNKDAVELLKSGRLTEASGTRNFVVFDDKLVNIVRRYGLAGAVSAGIISAEQARQMQEQGLVNRGT